MIAFRMAGSALNGLWSHRQRAIFSILAVAISVTAIVFLVSVVQGYRTALIGQVESIGVEEIAVAPEKLLNNKHDFMSTGFSQMLSFTSISSTLTYNDVKAVQEKAPLVKNGAPQYEAITSVSAGSQSREVVLTGTTSEYPQILAYGIDKGRFLTDADVQSNAKTAVLGSAVAHDLFGDQDPLGQTVMIKGVKFTVIGVMQLKEAVGFNFDERVYIPVTTMEFLTHVQTAAMLFFKANDVNHVNDAMQQVATVISQRHGTQDFGLLTPVRAEHAVNLLMQLVAALVIGVSGISFIVGGIGIMNVMLLTVRERTREIGVRKAVGASNGMVLLQFLLESMMVCLIGSVVGIAFAYAGMWELHRHFSGIPAFIPLRVMLDAIYFSIGFGVLFGLYPAFQATRVRPIEALRYE